MSKIQVTGSAAYGEFSILVDGERRLVMSQTDAEALLGELAEELLESATGLDQPVGHALGSLLEAMHDALARRQ